MSFSKSFKNSNILIEFKYGSTPTFVRVADSTSKITYGIGIYEAIPTLAVRFAPITGLLNEKAIEITVPVDNLASSFFQTVANGQPHPPVDIIIYERAEVDGTAQFITLFKGRMSRSTANYQGRPGIVMLEATNWKARLQVAMGIIATHHCPWTLGGAGCNLDLTPFVATATLVNISGKRVTLSGFPAKPDYYWNKGYLEFDDLRMMIRYWKQGNDFYLVRDPPSGWAGHSMKIVPGDDKTIETCRNKYDNEDRFGGSGYGIPNYNPQYEDKP
jgi:hypothetical protein